MSFHTLSKVGRRFVVGDISSPITGTYVSPPYIADPYYNYVATLLHFDGTSGNSAATSIDNGQYALVLSGSTAMILTGSSEFGTTCLNTGSAVSATVLTYVGSNKNIFNISASTDFTIEYWHKAIGSQPSYDNVFTTCAGGSGNNGVRQGIASGITFNFNTVTTVLFAGTYATLADGNWHHVSINRYGTGANNIKIYVDANPCTSISFGTSNIAAPATTTLIFGGYDNPGNGVAVDEFRWTHGVCRYTASGYTVPTAAFSNS